MQSLVVEQCRGFAVEGRHEIDAVVCDAEGRILEQVGEDMPTTFRSAAKPFQLECSLELLTAEQRAQLTSQDLAIGAASHHGERVHIDQVTQLLEKLGRRVEHLYCGAHAPSNAASAQALFASGHVPSALHNNCSGKHSFMAAASAVQGFAVDYLDPQHPLQQRITARVNERAGGSVKGVVVDGCGLPCFVLPLAGMARAWAQVAVGMKAQDALGRIGTAMHAHPMLFSGTDAFDGWLAQQSPVLAKIGAGGLLCAALPEQGLGLALKVRSGGDAVRPVAAFNVLRRWFPALTVPELPAAFWQVTNVVGRPVGEIRARWA